ncbi:hypothetical protein ACFORH_39040 [Amycolatopsis roodepoortensis]|uniref:Uncharacterized protein n=1 Tax=Amycolatopsis roodepoortensis TaxID=700274 RepID=A0ABR9LKA2_9PSEU|nr:hypothetical protein [Amycolatopsis roodepoortensis]MBE1580511.1 hypothetical protein [Amycolatopsis roodepoortensis]
MLGPIEPHPHYTTVTIMLECGHTRRYPLPIETIGQFPDYARPGVQWNCQACSPAYPSKSAVEYVEYGYGCTICQAAAPGTNVLPAPEEYRPHDFSHHHRTHDAAGFVIVRGTGEHGRRELTDVEVITGSGRYGDAVRAIEVHYDNEKTAAAFALVPYWADGCRLDRDHTRPVMQPASPRTAHREHHTREEPRT